MIWMRPGDDSIAPFVELARERWDWQPSRPASGAIWMSGAVQLLGKEDCTSCAAKRPSSTSLTDPTDPVLQHASQVLRAWPELRAEAVVLLDEILSLRPVGVPFSTPAGGGSCGPWRGWGSIMVEAANPVGYAEGVAHALGTHKLRAIGVEVEHHDGSIVENGAHELYDSPVRSDKRRPMSAILHDHYSYLHVTELELRAHELGYSMAWMLPHQIRRLTQGLAVIEEHARWTATGYAKLRWVIMGWTRELLCRCESLKGRL